MIAKRHMILGKPKTKSLAPLHSKPPPPVFPTGVQIAVLDRGFVYVGHCEIQGDYLFIKDARNIRRWGTTKGLGQLANSGPTFETILEQTGDLSVPIKALIFILQCKIQF